MNVNSCIAQSALLAITLLAAPAYAGGADPQQSETNLQSIRAMAQHEPYRGHQAVQLLALETNLTPAEVRMVSRTVMRNERYHFRSQRDAGQRFAQALGPMRYTAWSTGHPIELYTAAATDAAHQMANAASYDRNAAPLVAINP